MDNMSKNDALAKRTSRLSAEKLALLEKLTGAKGATNTADIPRRSVAEDRLPLFFAQQRLWFLDQLVPNSPAYNMVFAFHLSGHLQVNILEQCINEIVRRHEVLRTAFPSVNGQPYQMIASRLRLTLPFKDLLGYPEAERETRFQQLAREESQHIFDLAQGPLLRVTLFRLGEEKYILLLNVHHIIVDGWSMGVFLREINVLYQSFAAGQSSPLAELPIQYADFTIWRRQWLSGEVFEKQFAYWSETLGKDNVVLELPTDRTRPLVQTFHGGSLTFQLCSSLSKAIKDLCRQEKATLFMVLMAALKLLLHRYSGQNTIRVGTPIANRNRVEIEHLIGFFANILVLQTDLSGNASFTEVLARVRKAANSAYRHQDVLFEVLADKLQPERNMSQNPLFEVCFVLHNFPMPKEATALDFTLDRVEEIRNSTSKFDIFIQVIQKEDILDIDVEYNSDIFDKSTISRMLESFRVLLAGIVADPSQYIEKLPILSAEEE